MDQIGIVFAGGIVIIALLFAMGMISIFMSPKPSNENSIDISYRGTGTGVNAVYDLMKRNDKE